jgi:AraC-like DNA-binding protein
LVSRNWFYSYFYFIIHIYKKQRQIREYKLQAELLLKKSKEIAILHDSANQGSKENIFKEERAKSTILNKNIQDIKLKLERFESNKGFLKKNITVDSLAKDLGTNRDYLSKSVNELKGKNFSQYLNELRINYIVEELKTNNVLIKHTVSALAEDIGFNNSESFSNAFKKITGTLPSYYIKLLQTQQFENESFVK